MLPGTLDLIVLQLLDVQPTNGYDLAQRIQLTRQRRPQHQRRFSVPGAVSA
jgi:DNA-binding PadR family transcriptional regulator